MKQRYDIFILNAATLEALGPLDKRRWRETTLLTWEWERESKSEVFMFETQFIEEFSDAARDVIKQL